MQCLSTGAAITAILTKALATCGLELLEQHYGWEELTHTTKHSKKLAHKEPCLTQAPAAAAVAVITVASSQVKTRFNHVRYHGIFLQVRPERLISNFKTYPWDSLPVALLSVACSKKLHHLEKQMT